MITRIAMIGVLSAPERSTVSFAMRLYFTKHFHTRPPHAHFARDMQTGAPRMVASGTTTMRATLAALNHAARASMRCATPGPGEDPTAAPRESGPRAPPATGRTRPRAGLYCNCNLSSSWNSAVPRSWMILANL